MKELNKNVKIRTKMTISYIIIGVLTMFLLYSGYTTASTIISLPAERQASCGDAWRCAPSWALFP